MSKDGMLKDSTSARNTESECKNYEQQQHTLYYQNRKTFRSKKRQLKQKIR